MTAEFMPGVREAEVLIPPAKAARALLGTLPPEKEMGLNPACLFSSFR